MDAWNRALDELEERVRIAEQLQAGGADELGSLSTEWTAPSGLGPLPEPLLERATALLERQKRAVTALSSSLRSTSRQRGFATRVTEATQNRATPVYFDVQA